MVGSGPVLEVNQSLHHLEAGPLAGTSRLRALVLHWLRKRLSPQQIAARLRLEFSNEPKMEGSREPIYRATYLQARGNLRAELSRQVALLSGHAARHARSAVADAGRRSQILIEAMCVEVRRPLPREP